MTLRIGIDAWPLTANPTGIGRYVRELCLHLGEWLPEAEFFLYSPRPIEFPEAPHWHRRAGRRSALPGNLWLKWRAARQAAGDRLDVFWATRTLLPALAPRTPTLSTVYDLNYRIAPETMQPVNRWAHRLWFARDVRRATAVAAISQGTSDRLAQFVGRAADVIVRPAVSALYRRPPPAEISAALSRLAIPTPYLLSVGTREPRKNLRGLVAAHAALRERGGIDHTLVIAGGEGWGGARAAAERVRWLGYVPEADLPALYAGCDAFVFPSWYEGFGIPVLEARACGARIVANDIPEIREAGGSDAVYVAATIDGLIRGIERVLRAPRPVVSEAPVLPSWKDSAEGLAQMLARLARRRS